MVASADRAGGITKTQTVTNGVKNHMDIVESGGHTHRTFIAA